MICLELAIPAKTTQSRGSMALFPTLSLSLERQKEEVRRWEGEIRVAGQLLFEGTWRSRAREGVEELKEAEAPHSPQEVAKHLSTNPALEGQAPGPPWACRALGGPPEPGGRAPQVHQGPRPPWKNSGPPAPLWPSA